MENVLLTIAYDGSNFSGWQKQPNQRTVQGELEKALTTLCHTNININGTGRTDAGVHAWGQCATFKGEFGIPVERIKDALNNLLGTGRRAIVPGDIYIKDVALVPDDFHARFSAKGKSYVYRIRNHPTFDIFQRDHAYQVTGPLDLELMRQGAKLLKGTQDFKSFQASGGEENETTVRTIYSISIDSKENIISIDVKGDGFLYNMVRIIVGTLVEIGKGKIIPGDIKMILAGKDRQLAGPTAPAQGLYLAKVYFDVVQ